MARSILATNCRQALQPIDPVDSHADRGTLSVHHGADLSRGSRDELRDPRWATHWDHGRRGHAEARPGDLGANAMRHRDDRSLSFPVPIFVRRPDAASDLLSLAAPERRAHRHAPVTGFEWAMLLAGL